ncbi:UrcA family protein [Sphingomonas sp. SM33]|uniref:UrcA family protein n=1 Tax=Sphingomonas telluris TaxID=2907998 RepID=A0ABS9VQU4_9SPHN|nr:UrcA family protein [Sphingomonas telluris]MCH8617355.1 UrcA family protein [Sphingomonas telluris]
MNYGKIISFSAAVALASGVFMLVASPAHGKPVVVVANPAILTRHISFADLNLASSSGERTLNRRVGGAIGGLCSEATGGEDGSFTTRLEKRKCNNSAWGQARPQIARAAQRARDIASTGVSPIAAAAIAIDFQK